MVTKDCSTQKDAVAFHDVCVLRFSDESILGVLETSPYHCRKGRAPVGDPEALFEAIFNLSRSLINRTAAGDSQHKFALGDFRFNDSFGNTQMVYELMQCTPDLSESDCYNCLEVAVDRIRSCIGGLTGGRVLQPSCNLRYEQYIFWDSSYNAVPAPAPAILPSSGSNKTAGGKENATTRTLIIAIIVPAASLFMLGMIMLCLSKKSSSKKLFVLQYGLKLRLRPGIHEAGTLRAESLLFDFHVVQAATNNFSDDNKLGQGGFAVVYKGTLSDGREIAVKRPFSSSALGGEEFRNEVLLVAKLQHRNLVRLLGFCSEGHERLLIFEFLSCLIPVKAST
ncbi:hypothetical protein Droror1_Dr00010522 [Drosera rotundifolia]